MLYIKTNAISDLEFFFDNKSSLGSLELKRVRGIVAYVHQGGVDFSSSFCGRHSRES
jgi:hypothetical protein